MEQELVLLVEQLENKVEELRKNLGLSQEEFAKAIKVSRQTVSSIENGKYNPSLKLAMDIAKVFNTTVEDIFSFEKKSQEKADEVYKEKATKNVLA